MLCLLQERAPTFFSHLFPRCPVTWATVWEYLPETEGLKEIASLEAPEAPSTSGVPKHESQRSLHLPNPTLLCFPTYSYSPNPIAHNLIHSQTQLNFLIRTAPTLLQATTISSLIPVTILACLSAPSLPTLIIIHITAKAEI